MGHVDIRTTMRYVHGTDEGKRRAVEAAAIAVAIPSTNMAHGQRDDGYVGCNLLMERIWRRSSGG